MLKRCLGAFLAFILIVCLFLPIGASNPLAADQRTITEDTIKERIRNTRDYVFEQNGLYGIADKNGKIVVDAMYTDISRKMEDNRLWVVKEGKGGFLDENYHLSIEMIYDSVHNFSDGLAYVSLDSENFYIDVFGQAITPKGNYVQIHPSKGEEAIFYLDGNYGILNRKTGEIIIPNQYEQLFLLPSGKYLAGKRAGDEGYSIFTYYEVDHEGNEQEVPINDLVVEVDEIGYITIFREFFVDYTPTEYDSGTDGSIYKMGLIDQDYHEILEPIHEGMWPSAIRFSDEMAIIKTNSKNWTGAVHRGIDGDGQYGVINRAGQYILPPVYTSLSYLGYGKFLAVQAGVTTVIDIQGNKLGYSYRGIDKPSEWAKNDIEEASYLGLILNEVDAQSRYQWNITRQEFCELAMNLFVRVKGEEALPAIKDIEVFHDTKNESVLMAHSLGIVKGSDGAFSPYVEITRQEAAVMLTRLAAQLGLSAEESDVLFHDDADIAPWARESVYTLTTIEDAQTGKSIMAGKGNNMFAPLDPFTTEQTIVTMLRLYNVAVPVKNE